jgi:hypothetical protein
MRKTINVLNLLLLILFSSNLFAQETTSEIRGVIRDQNGPLSGASVSAAHLPTGTKYSTTTRKDGLYNLPNLRIGGPYTLTVTFVGYKTDTRDSITLILGQEYNADFTLAADEQQLAEVVVSSRQDKVFNTSHTGSQEIINRSQIERLPTINRSLQDFTKLTPFLQWSKLWWP